MNAKLVDSGARRYVVGNVEQFDQKNEMFGRQLKVLRGGSWNSNLDLARAALRGKALPDQRQNYIGFRCVRQP